MPLLSASSLNNRFTQLVFFSACLLGVVWLWIPHETVTRHLNKVPGFSAISGSDDFPPKPNHPIDGLIRGATIEFEALVATETETIHDAAEAYRVRRGRQPPPAFDMWFAFAQNHSAVVVEEFFDQIYTDLNPFWGVPAKQIREQANRFTHRISVRKGNAVWKSDIEDRPWMHLWSDLVRTIQDFLPDVDLPINVMDESRMVVPWEEINEYMGVEAASRKIVPEEELKTRYGTLKDLDTHPPEEFDPGFSGQGPYWPLAVVGCHPDSAARKAYIETDFSTPPPLSDAYPRGSEEGYVKNFTLARSPCDNAELQGLHGTFVEPVSIANTKTFFPLFGGSKLPMNNDILLPPAMYWTKDPLYSGGEAHGGEWKDKNDALIWRGVASGGRNKEENWTRFQRHRFISMVNASSVHLVETSGEPPLNFVLPASNIYDLAASAPDLEPGAMSEWISTWSNAAMVNLLCFPGPGEGDKHMCPYTDHYFTVKDKMPMKQQYAYKYLPDIDGNSFSGRYRGFLGSTSLPIKATIYQEWHDSRLVPWKHFVPMDNTFIDIYGIMEYFVGNKKQKVGGHDAAAEKIATEGKQWAERVLRREDMQIYVLRLLLEYARICDDARDTMGWKEEGEAESR